VPIAALYHSTFRNSGAGGAGNFLGQFAVELGGVDDEALVRAFGDRIDAVVGYEREAELAVFDLLDNYAKANFIFY
jgi:hypothetical protein